MTGKTSREHPEAFPKTKNGYLGFSGHKYDLTATPSSKSGKKLMGFHTQDQFSKSERSDYSSKAKNLEKQNA